VSSSKRSRRPTRPYQTTQKRRFMTISKGSRRSSHGRAVALETSTPKRNGGPIVLSSRTMKGTKMKMNITTFTGEGTLTNERCMDRVIVSRTRIRSTSKSGSSRERLISSGARHQASLKMATVAAKISLSSKLMTSSMSFSTSRDKQLRLV